MSNDIKVKDIVRVCSGELIFGNEEIALEYLNRSHAWRNVFDPSVGWFRPRRADGSWEPWDDGSRTKEGYGCIESNPCQQGWFVPHDIPGMVEAMGGREKVIDDLDSFFVSV